MLKHTTEKVKIYDTTQIVDLIIWVTDLCSYYSMDIANIGSFVEQEEVEKENEALMEISKIRKRMEECQREFDRKIANTQTYIFGNEVGDDDYKSFIEEIFELFCKVAEHNVIKRFDPSLKRKIAQLRISWGIYEVPQEYLINDLSTDPQEALKQLKQANARLDTMILANDKMLEEGRKTGYIFVSAENLLTSPEEPCEE